MTRGRRRGSAKMHASRVRLPPRAGAGQPVRHRGLERRRAGLGPAPAPLLEAAAEAVPPRSAAPGTMRGRQRRRRPQPARAIRVSVSARVCSRRLRVLAHGGGRCGRRPGRTGASWRCTVCARPPPPPPRLRPPPAPPPPPPLPPAATATATAAEMEAGSTGCTLRTWCSRSAWSRALCLVACSVSRPGAARRPLPAYSRQRVSGLPGSLMRRPARPRGPGGAGPGGPEKAGPVRPRGKSRDKR